MKYKVGDKVRVRSDLEESETYGDQTFVKQMEKYKGKLVTISEEHPRFYYIKEDKDENWCWTDEMFEPVEEMSAIEALEILAELRFLNSGKQTMRKKKSRLSLLTLSE